MHKKYYSAMKKNEILLVSEIISSNTDGPGDHHAE